MQIKEISGMIVVTVTKPNKYLKLKGEENSEELIGKPRRMVFGKDGKIPELEEKDV